MADDLSTSRGEPRNAIATSLGAPVAVVAPVVRHGRPDYTMEQIRERLQRDSGSIRELARRYGVNPKTVVRWRRSSGCAGALRRHPPRVGALTRDEETRIVAARVSLLLPLDDCLYLLRATIPHLTRSTLHRCLQRHGISCLQSSGKRVNWTQGSRGGQIGSFLVNVANMRCQGANLVIVSAVDIHSKLIYTEFHDQFSVDDLDDYFHRTRKFAPYKISSFLMGQSSTLLDYVARREALGASRAEEDPIFALWTDATTEQPADSSHANRLEKIVGDDHAVSCDENLDEVVRCIRNAESTYYRTARLKSLNGMTPHQYLCRVWRNHPDQFVRSPE